MPRDLLSDIEQSTTPRDLLAEIGSNPSPGRDLIKESIPIEFGRGLARGVIGLVPSKKAISTMAGIVNPAFKIPQDAIINGIGDIASPGFESARESVMSRPHTLKGQLAGGVGELIPALVPMSRGLRAIEGANALRGLRGAGIMRAMARPAAGFAGYEGAKESLTTPEEGGKAIFNVLKRGLQGAGTGAVFGAAGAPFSRLGRIGQTAGGALGMAATAPAGERTSAAILGGTLGLAGEGKRQGLTEKQVSDLSDKAVASYRGILKPTKGEVETIDMKRGDDINRFYKIIAEQGLPIEQVKRDGRNEIDTRKAREIVTSEINRLDNEQAAKIEKSGIRPMFSLESMRRDAHSMIDQLKKTGKAKEDMKADVDAYIDAEIKSRKSDMVDHTAAEDIKQSLWGEGYSLLRPTAKQSARILGSAIRKSYEKAFPGIDIQKTNKRIGDLLTINTLLEKAAGRPVTGGRLGGYFAKTIGAIAGSKIPIVGPIAGAMIGAKASEAIYDPAHRSNIAAKQMKKSIAGRLELPSSKTEQLPVLEGELLDDSATNALKYSARPKQTMIPGRSRPGIPFRPGTQNLGEAVSVNTPERVQTLLGRLKGITDTLPYLRRRGMVNEAAYAERQANALLDEIKSIEEAMRSEGRKFDIRGDVGFMKKY